MITEESIREAHQFLRENNHTIPDETLNFIKDVSLREFNRIKNAINYSQTLLAVEYGYKQCEQGKNLQETLKTMSQLVNDDDMIGF